MWIDKFQIYQQEVEIPCKTEFKIKFKFLLTSKTSAKLYIFFELPSEDTKKMIKNCKIDLPKTQTTPFYTTFVTKRHLFTSTTL